MSDRGRRLGATPEEWAHFDLILGLTADLLPAVADASLPVSPDSKLNPKQLGRVPSRLGDNGVVGIARWTELRATGEQVARWAAQPAYSLCVQSRAVRAIDIDVPDGEIAGRIADWWTARLGDLPCRGRANSGKRLLALRLEGELFKRIVHVEGGIVEFLGDGQQFLAAGTHPTGARYEWAGGLPLDIPTVARERFEAIYADFVEAFATGTPKEARARLRGATFDATDDVAAYIVDQGLALDQGRDGQVFVDCPWEADHTSDSGPTATAWFPAGSGGYAQGHFVCLHAHCSGRQDVDFLDAIGFRLAAFEIVAQPAGLVTASDFPLIDDTGAISGEALPPAEPLPWPPMQRDNQGRIEPTLDNAIKAFARPDMCGVELAFDEAIADQVMRGDASERWRSVRDVDVVALRRVLEQRGFKPVGRELARDALLYVCDEQHFDSLATWARSLRWDGVPRVEGFLQRYFSATAPAEATARYLPAVGRYWWSAAAGRLLQPGVQADMVPVLVGGQGLSKTQGLKALVPPLTEGRSGYVELNLSDDDDKLARKMRGAVLGEIAELRGLRSRDAEAIKAWVTRQEENWTPKYMERNVSYRRRLLFVGTTNNPNFLGDPTGERRWLPVGAAGAVDVAGLAADAPQLWAEGAAIFAAEGVAWREAQTLAGFAHGDFQEEDMWEAPVAEWLRDPDGMTKSAPNEQSFLRAYDVAIGALRLDPRNMKRSDEMRIGKILRVLGYSHKKARVDGRSVWVWAQK